MLKLLVTATVVCKVKTPLGGSDIPEAKVVQDSQIHHHNREILLIFPFFQKIIVSIVVNSANEKGFTLTEL